MRDGTLTAPWPDRVLEADYLEDRLRVYDQICADAGVTKLLDGPYILDLDLDVFNNRGFLEPDDPIVFRRLVRGALGISVAREPACCEEFWCDDAIGAAEAEALLMSLIGAALASETGIVGLLRQRRTDS